MGFSLKKRQASVTSIREAPPRRLENVRGMYALPKPSQWVLDFAMRTAMNVGSWCWACGVGLRAGYEAFHDSRARFREEFRKAPPIHVPAARAREDLESAIREGRLEWEE